MSNETENAFRVLQGESKIQSWRCRIGWHRWSIWEFRDANWNMGMMAPLARCHCVDCALPRFERVFHKKKNDE